MKRAPKRALKRACVIGWPIEHSRSPLIHQTWLKQYGIDGSYERHAVEPDNVQEFLNSMRSSGLAGCNVTVPHKEKAFEFADVKDAAARAVGAANTLWVEGDKICATNTDTYGFIAYLNHKVPNWSSARNVVSVLGAGGASRAIIYGLLEAGQKPIRLINRTLQRASQVQAHFGSDVEVVAWQDRNQAVATSSLIINTTSLGMNGQGTLDIDLESLSETAIVCDIVYTPLETELLRRAKARGLKTVDGLGMLLHQAVPGFETWFGVRPEVTDALYQIVAEDVRRTSC